MSNKFQKSYFDRTGKIYGVIDSPLTIVEFTSWEDAEQWQAKHTAGYLTSETGVKRARREAERRKNMHM